MADLRVALVGYGLAGRVFHAPLIAAAEGLRLASVVTANAQRQAQVRADHPATAVLPDLDAVLAAADHHDLAVVATTNEAHVPIASALLDAGLPVVVDKPLAVTAADARRLVERADRAGLLLTVFHNRRWDSDQLTLRRLLGEGRLGEVLRYESRFERWRPTVAPGKWRESLPAAEGGGILLDLGSHLVDQAIHLFGPVRSVYAEVDARRGGSDDDVFVALTHARGVRSHLWAGALAGSPGPRLRVLGTAGAYVVGPLDGQEAALRAGQRPGSDTWGAEPADRHGRLVRGSEAEVVPSERGRWDLFYPGVRRALRGDGPPPVPAAEAVTVLEVLEAARRAAATGAREASSDQHTG